MSKKRYEFYSEKKLDFGKHTQMCTNIQMRYTNEIKTTK